MAQRKKPVVGAGLSERQRNVMVNSQRIIAQITETIYKEITGRSLEDDYSSLTREQREALRGAANKAYTKIVRRQQQDARKAHGPMVQCQLCATWLRRDKTERLKPHGSTRYIRACAPCARTLNMQKAMQNK